MTSANFIRHAQFDFKGQTKSVHVNKSNNYYG